MEADRITGDELIDEALLSSLRATGGATVLAAMIRETAEQGDAVLERMRTALEQDDLDGVAYFAHQLVGMAESVAATRLAGLAENLERLARANAHDAELHRAWTALVSAHQHTCAALRARFPGG